MLSNRVPALSPASPVLPISVSLRMTAGRKVSAIILLLVELLPGLNRGRIVPVSLPGLLKIIDRFDVLNDISPA